jgi:Ser/Thr protein kinase RdoA (MazF antagonist)
VRSSGVLSDHCAEIVAAYELGMALGQPVLSARGEQGRVWRLDTDRGSYAVKELIVRQSELEAAQDVSYQEAVLASDGVRLPRPIRNAHGGTLTEHGPHQVRVYEWVDLLPVDRAQDPVLIGRIYAAIHQVRHAAAGLLIGWYTDPVGSVRWTELGERSEEQKAPFATPLADEIPFLIQLERLLTVPSDLHMCHRDLWSDNLPPDGSGGVCVIDWENCGLADPAQELPMALLDFCEGDHGRTATLYAAYLDAGGPARLQRRGDFTMVIAQFGHFWETAVESYLAPDASEAAKSHSLERIAELLESPLRLENIDAVLDWTSRVH